MCGARARIEATALHTDANLDIGGLSVPKGDYTLFVYLDPKQWQLVVSKATGEWGLDYDQSHDLGRVKMDMSKPPKPIETYKMTLSSLGPAKASCNSRGKTPSLKFPSR